MVRVAAPAIGGRLRAERQRQGMSARALARDVGVSASLISQIETGRTRPSVSTLYAITNVLGVAVEDMFEAQPPDGAADVVQTSSAVAAGGTPPVVAPGERDVLTLDSGVTWERLGQVPGAHVDFLRITYEPGGTSAGAGLLMRHPGTEYGYVLSGQLVLTLGFEDFRLGVGDAVSFDSTTPHGYRNDGTEPAVGVWFVLERSD